MSKFCKNCGSLMNDTDVFCANCSTKQDTNPTQNNAAQQTTGGAQANGIQTKVQNVADGAMKFTSTYVEKAKKDPKIAVIGIAAVVAVIVVIAILFSVFSGPAYKGAINDYFDYHFKGKYSKIDKMAPKEFWEYMEEEYDFDKEDYLEELEDNDAYDEFLELYEEEYGDNVKFSYKIKDEDELSSKKLDAIKDSLKENYDIAKKDVKKAYEVEIEMTIKGSDDKDTDDAELIVVNVGSGWYVLSYNYTFSY